MGLDVIEAAKKIRMVGQKAPDHPPEQHTSADGCYGEPDLMSRAERCGVKANPVRSIKST
jgi:hypothetical protein